MPDQTYPAPGSQLPDPASSYERAKPEKEAGQGRLTNNVATPAPEPDRMNQAVDNEHPGGLRQVNAQDVTDQRDRDSAAEPQPGVPAGAHLPPPTEPDHSMMEEEPDGWDMAPTDIKNPRDRRHPRTEGRGGTP